MSLVVHPSIRSHDFDRSAVRVKAEDDAGPLACFVSDEAIQDTMGVQTFDTRELLNAFDENAGAFAALLMRKHAVYGRDKNGELLLLSADVA